MSLIRLNNNHVERFELAANPKRTFASSSVNGITGSVALFADNSSAVKDVLTTNSSGRFFSDEAIENARSQAVNAVSNGNAGGKAVEKYMDTVHSIKQTVRANKRQEIIRTKPGARFNKNFMKKKVIKNSLFPYYKNLYPTLDWAFTNYNSINFFTGGNDVPTDSVIIYPAGTGTVAQQDDNFYAPKSAFTFDFYVNPRYSVETEGNDYHAGTILHMSSCYAISLISGSSLSDKDGKPDAFRILFQLSQSADIPPSQIAVSPAGKITTTSEIDSGFIFVTDDNALKLNNWHHVAIRWGGHDFQGGTGSICLDGGENTRFGISSASVMQTTIPNTPAGHGDPDALFIGNYYEGTNIGSNQVACFFNTTAATNEGVSNFNSNLESDPTNYVFKHPLNAEIHDLKIYKSYRSLRQIRSNAITGSALESDLIFYLPPFFVKESKKRNVLQTPFFDASRATEDPFNVALSFGIGGLSVNLENYFREFVRGEYPRLLNLSSSRTDTSFQEEKRDANYIMYKSPAHRKRNLTIVPNDNGKFFPKFDILNTGSQSPFPLSGSGEDRFVDFYGTRNIQLVSLDNMVLISTGTVMPFNETSGMTSSGKISLLQQLSTGDPENVDPGVSPGNILTILQRTKDNSSNEIAIFDISNMFYGDKIKPGTLVLKDTAVTGSEGRMTFTVKDNGHGSLYRADAQTNHAKWSNVGNVLYEEGIVIIKTPNMPFFGQDAFSMTFEGERSVYILEVTVPAERSTLNVSSNPEYKALVPSDNDSELAESFSYLTGLQLHDENLNVIMRTNFAQPIIKREEDRLVVRVRLDF